MRHLKNGLVVLLSTLLLITAIDHVAFAATGKSLLLGKKNTASKQTTIVRTSPGPVLKLKSKDATKPPLKVNGTGRVANLNADKLDGLDSSQLATKASVDGVRTSVDSLPVPVAWGSVASGAIADLSHTHGVAEVAWDSTLNRYLITLSDISSFYYLDYTVSITPGCSGRPQASYGSISGKLIAQFRDSSGNPGTCSFSFLVIKN